MTLFILSVDVLQSFLMSNVLGVILGSNMYVCAPNSN